MNHIEMIQVRTNTARARDDAVSAFQGLLPPYRDKDAGDVFLLRSPEPDRDLCIVLLCRDDEPLNGKGKSPLGLQLANAFSEFGLIHHKVWIFDGKLGVRAEKRETR